MEFSCSCSHGKHSVAHVSEKAQSKESRNHDSLSLAMRSKGLVSTGVESRFLFCGFENELTATKPGSFRIRTFSLKRRSW